MDEKKLKKVAKIFEALIANKEFKKKLEPKSFMCIIELMQRAEKKKNVIAIDNEIYMELFEIPKTVVLKLKELVPMYEETVEFIESEIVKAAMRQIHEVLGDAQLDLDNQKNPFDPTIESQELESDEEEGLDLSDLIKVARNEDSDQRYH